MRKLGDFKLDLEVSHSGEPTEQIRPEDVFEALNVDSKSIITPKLSRRTSVDSGASKGSSITTVPGELRAVQPQHEEFDFLHLLDFMMDEKGQELSSQLSEEELISNTVSRNVAVVAGMFANQAVVGSAAIQSAPDDPDNTRRINQVSGVAAGVTTLASMLPALKAVGDVKAIIQESDKLLREFEYQNHLLSLPNTGTPLKDIIESDQYSTSQKVVSAILLANEKMASRVTRFQIRAAGQGVTAVGVGLGMTAGFTGGFGALPAGAVATIGGGITMLPEAYGAGRALYKKFQNTKGIDRNSASEFLWALVLRKAKRENKLGENIPEKAQLALQKLNRYQSDLEPPEDQIKSENIATQFLKAAHVFDYEQPGEDGTLTWDRFKLSGEEGNADSGGYQRIMSALRSTAS